MSDLISKRAVLAKINLWANGELSTDKLIESIKKMSGGSLTDRPCEYCKNHVDGWCKAWKCVFDDMLTTKEEQALLQKWRDNRGVSNKEFEEAMDALSSSEEPCKDAISREAVLKIIDGWYEQNRDTDNIEDLIVLITYMDSVNPQKPICPSAGVDCEDCPAYENKSEWEHDHEILRAYSDGANEVLDKIRAEIEQTEINGHIRDVECFRAGLNVALNVIDKYKAESEGKE